MKTTIILTVLLVFLCKNDVYGVPRKFAQSEMSYSADGRSNKTYYLSPDKGNFFLAFLNCLSAGMELATIESKEESATVKTLLLSTNITDGWKNGYWLSGTALAHNETSEYHWFSTGHKIIYFDWAPHQPDNTNGIERCIEIGLRNETIGWNDQNCMLSLGYICQTRGPCTYSGQ
ncbi:C-type lectin 37Db-like [Sitophilus oryzae]|uniref:C-type lectin 37Db-like n=1 Tax=Sitophilus oryzae TaxID=7048 RepID=A0A6J2XA21_SITOR|nr:C-type lectin 37Db-like [Sitophilus oryzae]